MPLPIVFIAIAAGSALLGVGKSVKAGVDIHDAKKTNEKANDIVDSAKASLNIARQGSGSSLQRLGERKMKILNSSISHFIKSFGQLKNVDFRDSDGLNELNKLRLDSTDFEELKELSGFATNVAGGIAGGALGGALTAFGAYSAAGSFAVASTGTAIASLSGAAATNATLAFFGGGSLAAGGLGVAGGTMVLGGLVAGPALAIMGFIVGAKASSAKDDAYSNLAKAKEMAAEFKLAADLCHSISKRCNLFVDKLNQLDSYFKPLIAKIDEAINEHGTDYRAFSQEQKNATAAAASLAKAIKMVLDTTILESNGSLTIESGKILQQIDPKAITNGCGDESVLKEKSKQIKEIALPQIMLECESYVNTRVTRYDEFETEVKAEWANFDWGKFSELIRFSYGIDCTDEELREYVPIIGEKSQVRVDHVKLYVEEFIQYYQLSVIVSDCLKVENPILAEEDMDWNLLIKAVNSLYEISIAKWQLFHPGRNYTNDVINRISQKIDGKSSIDRKIYLNSEFIRKYNVVKASCNVQPLLNLLEQIRQPLLNLLEQIRKYNVIKASCNA